MKKYFLILFGNFESEDVCREVALSLTPLVDSPHLKFNHTNGSLIFHFASEVAQEEIYGYVAGTLFDISSSFILSENTDKVSLYFPNNVKEHLLDLENEGKDVEMKININQNRQMNDFEEDEDYVALLLEEVKKGIKKPSLDQILDKVLNKGFNSLTPFEKDILDEYSKN